MDEIWKDINGYEGHYKVSNTGRVYSCKSNKILRVHIKHYYFVVLRKNNIQHTKFLHRLIAEAFIPNPEHKPEVNHIDQNPLNNSIDNLEWVTRQENIDAYYESSKSSQHVQRILEAKVKTGNYKNSLAYKLFGKRYTQLSEAERKEYQKIVLAESRKRKAERKKK